MDYRCRIRLLGYSTVGGKGYIYAKSLGSLPLYVSESNLSKADFIVAGSEDPLIPVYEIVHEKSCIYQQDEL